MMLEHWAKNEVKRRANTGFEFGQSKVVTSLTNKTIVQIA